MKKLSRPTYSQIMAEFDKLRRKIDYKGFSILLIAITVITVSTLFMLSGKSSLYMVKVDNKTIGYIKDIDIYNKAVNDIKALNKGIEISGISAEKMNLEVNSVKLITGADIEMALKDRPSLNTRCYVISANGIEIARVKSLEDYHNIMDGLIKYYYPKDKSSKIVVKSGKILEKLTVSEIVDKSKNTISVSEAIKKIVAGRGADKVYKIKDGDTIWDIALANNLAVEDIQSANPKINLDKIKIGQVIRLAVNVPYVNVRITADINSIEQIPYDTKEISDKKVRRGTKRVKKPGQNGLASIFKQVVINNSDIIDENVISSKTIKKPMDEIVAIGAKSPLFAATGVFMRPSRGRMSSPFGRRWGKMHEGIDLAGPTGSPIDAADSGKVSFVGRRSGYGLCVMINHGNGLQTLYGHTSKTFVKTGQSVKKGQRIASVGSTGHSTGPHLHFEVRKNGVPVNPLLYLKTR